MGNPGEQEWRHEVDRLASEYRAQWGDARRPATAASEDEKAKAFNELMREFQLAWRRFAAREPDAASQILNDNVSATAKPGAAAGDRQAW